MEVKKAIKKMVALGTGLAMVGATLFGAAAADLSDYPAPMFIEEGSFNGVIVVGDSAAASDVIGSVDIATSLQYSSTVVEQVSGGAAIEPTISEGVKIEKSGNDLNFGEDIFDIQPTALDNSDLPEVLMDGTLEDTEGGTDNTETYTQELTFANNTATLIFDQDDDDAQDAGDYLKIERNSLLYTYQLEFDDSIEYTNTTNTDNTPADDLETVTLEIQGKVYTIVDVDASGGKIDKITFQAGETTSWLEEGIELSKAVGGVTHTIVLQDVNEDEDKCGIMVDDTLAWVDKGQTKTVNGVSLGVTDAIVVHSAGKDTDVCEVNLGAEEIVLEDGQEIEINSADIDGSEVTINGLSGQWDGLTITYEADEEIWLAPGEEFVDPVFGNFMIKYSGLTKVTEEIEIDVAGESAELSFESIDGEDVEIDIFCNDECDTTDEAITLGTGQDRDEVMYLSGGVCTGLIDIADCEGATILVSANMEAHVVEIDDIDTSDLKIVMKDLTYRGSTKESTYNASGGPSIIDLPSGAGTIVLTITDNVSVHTLTVTGGNAYVAGANLETDMGGYVTINESGYITVQERGDEDADLSANQINITLKSDSSDEEIDVDVNMPAGIGFKDKSDTNDDQRLATTNYGTLVEYDQEDKRWVKISYAEEEVYGNVFVAPTSAVVTAGGATGTISTTVVQKIQVGAAKLASEVANIKAVNAIVVGGPCANAAAATLMGNPEKCWEAVPENKAIIKLYENAGNVALLVAGRSALDTRRASRVLANSDDYDLSGSEVEVTGTSLTDISVSAPQ